MGSKEKLSTKKLFTNLSTRTVVIICASLFSIVFLFLFFIYYKDPFNNEQTDTISVPCVCAFDLDNTLTCGISRAAKAVDICKKQGCKIAINTARPTPWFSDLKLKRLGLEEIDFKDDFYHIEPFKCSFQDNNCLSETISNTKSDHLDTISKKYSVPKNKVILFDDQWDNVKRARERGFSGIYANHPNCGISQNVHKEIDKILKS
jgi:hypothetical protein